MLAIETQNSSSPLIKSDQDPNLITSRTKGRRYKGIPTSTDKQYFIPNNILWIFGSEKKFFESKMCNYKLSSAEFENLLSEIRIGYADSIARAKKWILVMRLLRIGLVSLIFLNPILLSLHYEKGALISILMFYVLTVITYISHAKESESKIQVLISMQDHFNNLNRVIYDGFNLHFLVFEKYIQIVFDYKEADADIYRPHHVGKWGKVPESRPGHYYFQTNILEQEKVLEDGFEPYKIGNKVPIDEYRKFKERARSRIQQEQAMKTYKFDKLLHKLLELTCLIWFPLSIWLILPLHDTLVLASPLLLLVPFALQALITVKLARAEEAVLAKAQEIIDESAKTIKNADKFHWKLISFGIMYLKYPKDKN